jgi:hypothetical protein
MSKKRELVDVLSTCRIATISIIAAVGAASLLLPVMYWTANGEQAWVLGEIRGGTNQPYAQHLQAVQVWVCLVGLIALAYFARHTSWSIFGRFRPPGEAADIQLTARDKILDLSSIGVLVLTVCSIIGIVAVVAEHGDPWANLVAFVLTLPLSLFGAGMCAFLFYVALVAAGPIFVARSRSEEISPAARLEELSRLHKNGLVTDDEYQAKRREILDRL